LNFTAANTLLTLIINNYCYGFPVGLHKVNLTPQEINLFTLQNTPYNNSATKHTTTIPQFFYYLNFTAFQIHSASPSKPLFLYSVNHVLEPPQNPSRFASNIGCFSVYRFLTVAYFNTRPARYCGASILSQIECSLSKYRA